MLIWKKIEPGSRDSLPKLPNIVVFKRFQRNINQVDRRKMMAALPIQTKAKGHNSDQHASPWPSVSFVAVFRVSFELQTEQTVTEKLRAREFLPNGTIETF